MSCDHIDPLAPAVARGHKRQDNEKQKRFDHFKTQLCMMTYVVTTFTFTDAAQEAIRAIGFPGCTDAWPRSWRSSARRCRT
jgi:hypothetical protein